MVRFDVRIVSVAWTLLSAYTLSLPECCVYVSYILVALRLRLVHHEL